MKWPIGIEEENYKKPFVDFLAFKVNHSNRCYNSYSLIVPLAQKLFFPFLVKIFHQFLGHFIQQELLKMLFFAFDETIMGLFFQILAHSAA